MESAVISYYSNLDAPYQKFKVEKAVAPKTKRFGLSKMLNDNSKQMELLSLSPIGYDVGIL